jgi:L-ascorbate metabolism protein UlaG (beta-lactamase superfamily)
VTRFEPPHALRGAPPPSSALERSPLWLMARSYFLPTAPATQARLPAIDSLGDDAMSVTYIGHATALVQVGGVAILTDPNFSHRLMVPKRIVAPGVPLEALPQLDIVLVSHGHLDHLDLPTHRRLRKDAVVVCARNLGDLLASAGHRDIVELGWGESITLRGATITALEVNHWGTRGFFDDHRGYTGFLVETAGGSFFFPGDTAYFPHFAEYGRRYAIDLALLPIGAYNPFRRVHMNPEDALQAFFDLRARYLVPIHWGTFVLSLEPVDEPPRWLASLAAKHGVSERVKILRHGMSEVLSGRSAREAAQPERAAAPRVECVNDRAELAQRAHPK